MEVRDKYGRTFKTLRVSLIDTCNLSCIYCTCGEEELKENYKESKSNSLNYKSLSLIIQQLHSQLGLETIRFTGGEPLLYKNLPEIVQESRIAGISNIKLTTNGVLLERMAPILKEAGVTSINVSLDAVEEEAFHRISRRSNVKRILNGIEAAKACGIDTKINAVVMRGINDDQIIPLVQYAFDHDLTIRFLEIMAMGHLYDKSELYFYSQEEILDKIAGNYLIERLPRKASSTANYWKTNTGNTFGIVANESEPFCSDCNRLRLDSQGNIYGCLSNNFPISLRNNPAEKELSDKLLVALEQKQALKFTGSKLSMLHIGG